MAESKLSWNSMDAFSFEAVFECESRGERQSTPLLFQVLR